MQPVLIDGCTGWLHAPATGGSETAVLVCPALGREACVSYRALRLLADRLAAAGYAVLRLEYPGSGDSAELTEPAPEAWLAAIRAAANRLLALSGATRIVVCGFRIGALLGMAATAGRADVAALMLLAPPLSGRDQTREWLAAERFASSAPEAGYMEADGCQLPRDVLDRLTSIELRRVPLRPEQAVLLLAANPSAAVAACVEAWRGGGAEVATLPFEGLKALLHANFEHPPPLADFDRAIAWLRNRHPPRGATPLATPDPAPSLPGDGWIEEPLRFGSAEALVGTLARPAGDAPRDLVVIIGNTAADPRAGFGRSAVVLARYLAARGIASLRMDFAGLGDSRSPEERGTHAYETDRMGDFRAAIDALAQCGYRRFCLQGSCSGAYHVFHAALAEPRVERVLLVNQIVFQWHIGDQIEQVARVMARRPAAYLRALGRPEAWRRLRKGELDVGKVLRAQLVAAVTRGARWLRGRGGTAAIRPRKALEALARRGVAVFVLLGAEDLSARVWEEALGQKRRGTRELRGLTVRIEPDLDHVPTTRRMRQRVAELLGEALLDEIAAVHPAAASPKAIVAASPASAG